MTKKTRKSTYIAFINTYIKFYSKGWKTIAKGMYWLNRFLFTCDIPPTVKIGENLRLPHFGLGVVIEPRAVIGNNCTIYQHVTIGARNGMFNMKIGDNVLFGCGCKVLGCLELGDNVKIGANAVVVHSVPSGCTVVGIPGKILDKIK